jgi:tetratricopeptide (TPR) repeat protein
MEESLQDDLRSQNGAEGMPGGSRSDQRRRVLETGLTVVDHVTGAELASHLIVSFAHHGLQQVDGPGYAEDALRAMGFDVLAVSCRRNNWYQDLSAEAMQDVMAQLPAYRSVACYGSDMGAYAAVYFGQAVGAKRVIALSPQFSVNPDIVRFDPRWAREAADISFTHEPLSQQMIRAGTRYWLIYDPLTLDGRHAELIKATGAKVTDCPLPYCGHPARFMLEETGELNRLVQKLALGRPWDVKARVRKHRRKSPAYYFELAQAASKRHPETASALFSQMARLGDRSDMLLAYSRFMLARRQPETALQLLERAWPRLHVDAHLIAYRGHLLELTGDAAGSLASYSQAIEQQPEVLAFYVAERRLLRSEHRHLTMQMAMTQAKLSKIQDEAALKRGPVAQPIEPIMWGFFAVAPIIIALLIWSAARALNLV